MHMGGIGKLPMHTLDGGPTIPVLQPRLGGCTLLPGLADARRETPPTATSGRIRREFPDGKSS